MPTPATTSACARSLRQKLQLYGAAASALENGALILTDSPLGQAKNYIADKAASREDERRHGQPMVIDVYKMRGLYAEIYSYENLYQAYLEARKGKRFRPEVLGFTNNLEANLIEIQNELIWRTYQIGPYREFYVHEPKLRLIMALPFRDRVVQWAIYRVLNPRLDKRYISDSYACRPGYGVHRAVKRLQYWMRYMSRRHQRVYVLKMDVSKYFYRIDHDILMDIFARLIDDDDLLWLLDMIYRNEDPLFGLPQGVSDYSSCNRTAGCGMPVGNLTSQMAANLYLNEVDQFIKHDLRVRRYMRYMDDMAILHHDKQYLWEIKREVEGFLANRLHLDLNSKTTVRSVSQGVEWLGYRVWPTHIKLRKSTAQKMRKRLRYLQNACSRGEATPADLNTTWQSYRGMLKHCNSYRLQRKLEAEIGKLN